MMNKTTATDREKFIWNMLGSLANAFSTLILSICVNRILGEQSGGIFAFAYANAQLLLTVGGFEVRPYQSTDIREKYGFSTYFTLRLFTCGLMMLFAGCYIFWGDFSGTKRWLILLLAAFKCVEAFTDVFAGRFQQKDRIDLSGKIFFIRVTASTLMFILLIGITGSLVAGAAGMLITSFGLFWLSDLKQFFPEDRKQIRIQTEGILKLSGEVLPLFIGAFLMMYISNAPKYAIDELYSDELQNVYNILFMPAFVINLFSLFVFRPMLVKMAIYWNDRKLKELWKIIFGMYGLIGGLTALAAGAAWLIGIPVLELLYGTELEEYRLQLAAVMMVGGISAFMTFCSNVITVMRKQRFVLAGYGLTFLYVIFFVRSFVRQNGINGAILSYGIAVGLLVLIFNVIMIMASVDQRKKG